MECTMNIYYKMCGIKIVCVFLKSVFVSYSSEEKE